MALWTGSGVRERASRLGSSPRRTSISWTRSSKLALVMVAGSVARSIGAGFMGSLSSRFVSACVLEGVHHGFFEPHPFKMRLLEATLQYFEDLDRQIFGGGHMLCEFFNRIQILQVISAQHLPSHQPVQVHKR